MRNSGPIQSKSRRSSAGNVRIDDRPRSRISSGGLNARSDRFRLRGTGKIPDQDILARVRPTAGFPVWINQTILERVLTRDPPHVEDTAPQTSPSGPPKAVVLP